MSLTKVKLFSATKAATLDSALAAYKAGVGAELLINQRAMTADMIKDAGGNTRAFLVLAHGGLDVPASKTADLQHVTVQMDAPVSALQAAIDADLARVIHATDTSGDTTVASQVEVGDPVFFEAGDVGRLMVVEGVEKLITAITDDAIAAAGSLLAVAKAAPLADGDNFTLDDGLNPATVFEFQVTGGFTPVPGRVPIDIQLLTLAPEIGDAMRTAIAGVGASLRITPDATGLALINLTNDIPGAAGNVAITESIAGATLSPVGMTGGADATASIAHYAGTALASGIAQTVQLLGAEVIQGLYLSTILDRDRDTNMLLLVACEGQLA